MKSGEEEGMKTEEGFQVPRTAPSRPPLPHQKKGHGDVVLGCRPRDIDPGRFPPVHPICVTSHTGVRGQGVTSISVAGWEGLAGCGQRCAAPSSVPSVVDPGQQALGPLAPYWDS